MQYTPVLDPSQANWLHAQGYEVASLVARGKSAGVWKLRREGQDFAAKVEHVHSTRVRMSEKEARHLQMANDVGVGPTFVDANVDGGIVIMQWIDGPPLARWLETRPSSEVLHRVLHDLFAQAQRLDAAGLDHGQLGGKLHNVLVDPQSKPWIIDFEKASYVRGTHNVSKLRADLFQSGKWENILPPSLAQAFLSSRDVAQA